MKRSEMLIKIEQLLRSKDVQKVTLTQVLAIQILNLIQLDTNIEWDSE